jgi:hypothetical protein
VLAAMLPPSHIHLAEHDHDHSAVEHSHWSSHGGTSRRSIDDDDGQAIYVDHPGVLGGIAFDVVRPQADTIAVLSAVEPPAFERSAPRLAGNAPRDGPVLRVPTLRGPPLVD